MRERSMHLDPLALLSLLRWVSPTLPVGAYAYSRGLEQAVSVGWVHDEQSALAWIAGLLEHGLAQLDAPVFARLHEAFSNGDVGSVVRWNAHLSATRESRELALEDEQMGQALLRLLRTLTPGTDPWPNMDMPPSYVTMFAYACVHGAIALSPALLGFLWTTCESQTSAAVRLIPLGQSAGQRMLSALARDLPGHAAHALTLADDELGSALPALAIASARHETQYTRLFRS